MCGLGWTNLARDDGPMAALCELHNDTWGLYKMWVIYSMSLEYRRRTLLYRIT